MKKRGLGKGLDALFSSDEVMEPQEEYMPVSEEPSSEEIKEKVQIVDIYTVEPDREQPRKNFDPEKLQELSDSIRQYGVLQPLLVQKEKDYYKIIAGERRWRAARLAGLTEIPVIVKEFTPQDSMAVSLIENLQRQNLNPMEESMAYQKLLTEFSMTQEQIAEKLGKSRSAIANSLRLQNLPEAVQKSISEGMISMGHAKVLLGLDDKAEQTRLAVRIIGEKLSVRELEQILAEKKPTKAKKKSEKKETAKDLATRMAEERMKELLGTQVSIKKGAKKGKIEIEYHSEEELDRILNFLEARE
ncbi:MAG TPA: ParB/RepB/Spo0J family partition protein [Candidatus Faecimorpha stercoravium]|nr:ParB/RepB/Spo0J family partition protein [Candidatus Faecimorpha stercoravium]